MKLTTMIKTAVAVVAMAAIATFAAPVALAAYPITGKLGSELTMTDTVGQVVLGWKVSDLKSSTAVIPGYPVAGQVWEATATVNAIRGSVTPAVSQFNARTADGISYRVLWQAAGPDTISGATIPPRRTIDRQNLLRCHRPIANHRRDEQRHGGSADLGAVDRS